MPTVVTTITVSIPGGGATLREEVRPKLYPERSQGESKGVSNPTHLALDKPEELKNCTNVKVDVPDTTLVHLPPQGKICNRFFT